MLNSLIASASEWHKTVKVGDEVYFVIPEWAHISERLRVRKGKIEGVQTEGSCEACGHGILHVWREGKTWIELLDGVAEDKEGRYLKGESLSIDQRYIFKTLRQAIVCASDLIGIQEEKIREDRESAAHAEAVRAQLELTLQKCRSELAALETNP